MYMQVDVEGAGGRPALGQLRRRGRTTRPTRSATSSPRLKDEDGKVRIPGFYDNVRKLAERERREVARLPFTMEAFLEGAGNPPRAWGEPGIHVLERIWARPTLEVNGIWGGYQGEGAKTVLPARAAAKISMRLVPDQTPEEAERKFTAFVKKLAPRTVKVKVTPSTAGRPSSAPPTRPSSRPPSGRSSAPSAASRVLIREGGSIPFTATIQEALGVPVILMGFGLPDENSHAPNERLDLENYQRGILAAAYLYEELAARPAAPAAGRRRGRAGAREGGARDAPEEAMRTRSVLATALVAALRRLLAACGSSTATDGTAGAARVPVGDSPVDGPADAWVTVVEFSDFQCPFCVRVQPTLAQVLPEYGPDVRHVFKHFPLSQHARAIPAAVAAECARAQGALLGVPRPRLRGREGRNPLRRRVRRGPGGVRRAGRSRRGGVAGLPRQPGGHGGAGRGGRRAGPPGGHRRAPPASS